MSIMDHTSPTRPMVYTVGHSNLELPQFISLIARHHVEAIADVRSNPFSRYVPQFNRDVLETALRKANVRYVPMGDELGARRGERECYVESKARYELIAKAPLFQKGLDRVRKGTGQFRLALMCSEKDPLTCHRTILVCRQLRPWLDVRHILESGELESTVQAEDRLLALLGMPPGDLFQSRDELVEQAYEKQGGKIAYVEPVAGSEQGIVMAEAP